MLNMMYNYFVGFVKKEEGQGMIEYVLLVALIAIVVIVAIGLVGDQLVAKFNEIVTALTGA